MALYQPLSRDRREIRLVRIHPNPDPAAPLILHLRHVSLDDDPAYEVLSYQWGDAHASQDATVNETPVALRENLYHALLQLRARPVESWIWIDALCINQADLEERGWQVGIMCSIFSGASQGYIWLGLHRDRSAKVMRFLKTAGEEVLATRMMRPTTPTASVAQIPGHSPQKGYFALRQQFFSYADKVKSGRGSENDPFAIFQKLASDDVIVSHGDAVERFLERDYFSRIWVIQEWALLGSGTIMCGPDYLSLEVFEAAITALELSLLARSVLPRTLVPAGMPIGGTHTDLMPLNAHVSIKCGDRLRMADQLIKWSGAPDRPFYAASDPRDLIYGLLGCASDVQALGLHADYHKSVPQTFAEATKAFMLQYPKSQYLEYCAFPKETPGLPSWVPDYVRVGKRGIWRYPLSYTRSFFASGTLEQAEVRTPDPAWNILRQSGCRVDIIQEVMEPFAYTDHCAPDMASMWARLSGPRVPMAFKDGRRSWLQRLRGIFKAFTEGVEQVSKSDFHGRWDFGDEAVLKTICDFFNVKTLDEDACNSVLRTICGGVPGQSELMTPEWLFFMRKLVLEEPVAWHRLSETQQTYFEEQSKGRSRLFFARSLISAMEPSWRFRTVFKTKSGRFGLGPQQTAPGDIVAILWGHQCALALRPLENGQFEFLGDTYVDGIMDGEFVETKPEEEVFDLV